MIASTTPSTMRVEYALSAVFQRIQRVVSIVLIATFMAHPTLAATLPSPDSAVTEAATLPAKKSSRSSFTPIFDTKGYLPEMVNKAPVEKVVEKPLELPTPSGALSAYPANHTMDGLNQIVGTPPVNHNITTPGYAIGTPPTNFDFSTASFNVGTPPANSDFQTGNFTGWLTSTVAGSVQISNTNTFFAQLNNNGVITSSAFTVDASAQQIRLDVGYLATSAAGQIYALSGATYATQTLIGTFAACNGCGWRSRSGDLSKFQGQSIKLRIVRTGGTVGIDNIRQTVLLPGFAIAGDVDRLTEVGGNVFAAISATAFITTAAFTIDPTAQRMSVRLSKQTSGTTQYQVDVMSGANFSTATLRSTGTLTGTWITLDFDISQWVGQQIKLRVKRTTGIIGVDDIALQSVIVPSWQITDNANTAQSSVGVDPDGNRFANVHGTLTSPAFTIDAQAQQMTLRYRGATVGAQFSLNLLTGPNFTTTVAINSQTAATTTWQTATFGINLYAGQQVKLRIATVNSRVHFDDIAIGASILPHWTIANLGTAVAIGQDSFGTYVTPGGLSGNVNSLSLESQLFNSDVVIPTSGTGYRAFAISYEIGFAPSSTLLVQWRRPNGTISSGYNIDAAASPTGFRTRYFVLDSGEPLSGKLKITLTNGGKLYSVADNVARQHLTEPFSFKVGMQIDTSTGSFGYQTTDMEVGTAFPIVFGRYYNGHADWLGSLGYGWSHTYETRLDFALNSASVVIAAGVVFGSGKEVFFNKSGSTFIPADARIHDKLVLNGDGTYTYTSKENMRFIFSSTGKLGAIKDLNDNTTALAYNGSNQLTTITAPGGITLTLSYLANGRLGSITNVLGAAVTYLYDPGSFTDLTSVIRPATGAETYTYDRHRLQEAFAPNAKRLFKNVFDSNFRVVQQTDALTKTIVISYSTPALGVTSVTDPDGNTAQYYFDRPQRTTDRVDPLGNTITYIYDNLGNMQNIANPASGQWTFSYDANGNLLTSRDPNPIGNPVVFTYNPLNLPTEIRDANLNVTRLEYDNRGNIIKTYDPYSQTTTYAYDSAGRVISQTNPLGYSETNTYDARGNRLTHTDANGALWRSDYDVLGRLITETNPLGYTKVFGYDLAGRLITVKNFDGSQRTLSYDTVGRLGFIQDELQRIVAWNYNDRGLAESKLEEQNKLTYYTYDGRRNLTEVIDPLGAATQYVYDENNRLEKIIYPTGTFKEYTYDSDGRLVSKKDELGRVTTYTYDNAGRKTSMTEPNTGVYTWQYDANGNLLRETDPINRSTYYGYDALNRTTVITDAAGFVTRFVYDAAGRQTAMIDPLNNVTQYGYDRAGRTVVITDALGSVTHYGYDVIGNQTVITNALGYVQTTTYDSMNRVIAQTDVAGNLTQFAYDAAGHLIQRTDPTTAITRYGYDTLGRQTVITDTLNRITTSVYDKKDRLIQVTDAANQITRYGYDTLDRMTVITDALGKMTTYAYDFVGNRTGVTDPLGRTTTTAYNPINRPTAVTDSANRTTNVEYDLVGQMLKRTLPSGRFVTFSYDNRGLLLSLTNNMGQNTAYEYDPAGRQTKMTDARGYATRYGYDAVGRQITITNAISGVVRLAYDPLGRMTSLTNYNGFTTTYTYNAFGSVLTQTNPLGQAQSNTYDPLGRLVTRTDARGIAVNYTYDTLNRLATVTRPGGVETYVYDALDRLSTVTDPSGVVGYTYDPLSRVTQVNTPQGAVGYSYNDAGQRASMTLPSNRTVTYGYNNAGELANITDWVSGQVSYAYDGDGNPIGVTRPNGVNSTYGYDSAGRLNAISHNGPGGNLLNFNYTLDANGNRTALTSNLGNESYTLDPLERLTQATYGNGDSVAYNYDANGNRLLQTVNVTNTTTYSYNNAGQLTAAGVLTYTYDANGNLTTAGTNNYAWDYDNRLVGATVNGTNASYSYDSFGVRVSSIISGVSSSYLWDRLAENPLLISDGSFAYLHNDGPLTQYDASNNRTYHLNDALHSVRGVSDGSGGLIGSASYDAFGGVRSQSGASSAFGFTGELYSAQTGLLHLRARDYQATMGRLLSADTQIPNAADGVGYNLYAYVANNPTRWTDPSGHQTPMAMAPQLSEFGYLMMSIGLSGLELMRGGAGLFGGSMSLGSATFLAGFVFAVLAMLCLAAVDGPCYTASRVVVNAYVGILPCSVGSMEQSLYDFSNVILYMTGNHDDMRLIDPRSCLPEPEDEEESVNQMRVQLQRSRNGRTMNTDGIALQSSANVGVTTLEVRNALSQLYGGAQDSTWFPKSQLSALYSAIVVVSERLHRYPPNGTSTGGNIERSTWRDGRDEYRVDVENLRGKNLRK